MLEMMKGSEGNPDYLLIARRENVALGVKPHIVSTPLGTLVGVNLRSAKDPQFEGYLPAKALVERWPEIMFDKFDNTRASVFTARLRMETMLQYEELKKAIDAVVVPALVDWFKKVTAPAPLANEELLKQFLVDTYALRIDQAVNHIVENVPVEVLAGSGFTFFKASGLAKGQVGSVVGEGKTEPKAPAKFAQQPFKPAKKPPFPLGDAPPPPDADVYAGPATPGEPVPDPVPISSTVEKMIANLFGPNGSSNDLPKFQDPGATKPADEPDPV